jgi:hypothetical protein
MSKPNEKEKVVNQTETKVGQKTEEKKEAGMCYQCKWYDVSTEKQVAREKVRPGLVETRAVCHNHAKGRLVMRMSQRSCFEPGTYVAPVKEEKKKETVETPQPTPVEPSKPKSKKNKVETIENSLNDTRQQSKRRKTPNL